MSAGGDAGIGNKKDMNKKNEPNIDDYMTTVPAVTEPTRIKPAAQENLEYREGDILQKYELGEKLANTENGGQGTVYMAKRKLDGLDTVVKVYATAETGNWDDILNEEKRAGREIRFIERANREGIPGVPRIVQYGVTGSFIKTPVAVFDFIPGKSLEEEVLDESYSPSPESVLGLFSGLFPALEYAHHSNGTKPVVHRDINPGNIKVNGHPILMDWASSTPTSGKTQLRTQMFTEYFTAPEVVEGNRFDGRADIYSMGKVLEFMLLGRGFRDAEGNPKTTDFDRLNIPKEIAKILRKATMEDPERRYSTIKEFYVDFQRAYRMPRPEVPARVETKTNLETRAESQQLIQEGEKVVAVGAAGAAGVAIAGAAIAGAAIAVGVAGAAVGAVGAAGAAAIVGAAIAVGAAENIDLSTEKQNYHIIKGGIYGGVGAIANILQALFLHNSLEQKVLLGAGIQFASSLIEPSIIIGKYYLSGRKLREKPLAAGLDKDGMREIGGTTIGENDYPSLKYTLTNHYKFKHNHIKHRFSADGVKVDYKKRYKRAGAGIIYVDIPLFDITIRTKPGDQQKAEPVIDQLRGMGYTVESKIETPKQLPSSDDDIDSLSEGISDNMSLRRKEYIERLNS